MLHQFVQEGFDLGAAGLGRDVVLVLQAHADRVDFLRRFDQLPDARADLAESPM